MIINPVEKSKYLLQLDVVLEASEINNLFKKELNKTAKTSKMKGFRPGKTPTNLVKNLYGTQMMVELVNKNLVSQVYEYLDKEGIKTFSNFVFDTEDFNYKFTPNDIQDFSASLLVVKEPAVEWTQLIGKVIFNITFRKHNLKNWMSRLILLEWISGDFRKAKKP
ncbi:MAG: hypothetical protein IPL69_14985 [Saprospiraceae bacterium]|nr:hypothetical protein [Candidatus Brachybacter algidus]